MELFLFSRSVVIHCRRTPPAINEGATIIIIVSPVTKGVPPPKKNFLETGFFFVMMKLQLFERRQDMAYTAKDYNNLIGMEGFSETLLKNHFTLYQGYVTNTNKVMDTLAEMAKGGKIGTPAYAELKRRLGWEFNGMRLHELYFANLGGDGDMSKAPNLMKKKQEQFGSVEMAAKD